MKGRAKIKKLKSAGLDVDELNNMFNQMLGTTNINLTYAWPRYQQIRALSAEFVGYVREIATSKPVQAYFPADGQDLGIFCDAVENNLAEIMGAIIDPASITPEEHVAFTNVYNSMLGSHIMSKVSDTCKQLHVYAKYITATPPTSKFVETIPGVEWYPIPFSQINFKALLENVGPTTAEGILTALANIYDTARDICRELQAPNVDIDKFAEIIIASLEQIQKEPRLARCKTAFAKIRESIDLLKGNFTKYYADFIDTTAEGSGNGFIIMEHFIADVSRSTKGGAQLKREFAQIMKFFYDAMERQKATMKGNPQMESTFSRFGSIFEAFNADEEMHIDTVSGDSSEGREGDVAVEDTPEMAARRRAAEMSIDDLAAEIEGVSAVAVKKQRAKKK